MRRITRRKSHFQGKKFPFCSKFGRIMHSVCVAIRFPYCAGNDWSLFDMLLKWTLQQLTVVISDGWFTNWCLSYYQSFVLFATVRILGLGEIGRKFCSYYIRCFVNAKNCSCRFVTLRSRLRKSAREADRQIERKKRTGKNRPSPAICWLKLFRIEGRKTNTECQLA